MKTARNKISRYVKLSKDDNGFTLMELLFSLMLFFTVTSLSLQIVMAVQKHSIPDNGMDDMEWELFLTDLQWEIRNAVSHETKSNKLYIIQNDRVVSFEQYGSNIRRRVDQTGHEVMLQRVHTFRIAKEEHAIVMAVTDALGREFTAEFSLYD